MFLCSNSSLAVWVRLNRMCTTCLLLVVWRGCFIISWDKIWSQLLIDLNSPDMTVNPNPLYRAQWLFSTSFFFLWLSTDKPSHGSPALPWLFAASFAPPWPRTSNTEATTPWWDLPMSGWDSWLQICPLVEMLSPICSPRSIITLSSRERKRRFVIWENPTFCAGLMWGWMAVSPSANTVGISSNAFQREEVFVGQRGICLASSAEIFALAEGLGGENQMVPRILWCWTSPVGRCEAGWV